MMMMMVHSANDVCVISMPGGRMGPSAMWKGSYCTVYNYLEPFHFLLRRAPLEPNL